MFWELPASGGISSRQSKHESPQAWRHRDRKTSQETKQWYIPAYAGPTTSHVQIGSFIQAYSHSRGANEGKGYIAILSMGVSPLAWDRRTLQWCLLTMRRSIPTCVEPTLSGILTKRG